MGQRTIFDSPSIMYNLTHVVLEAFSVHALLRDYVGRELSMLQTVPLFDYSVIQNEICTLLVKFYIKRKQL